MYPTPPSPQTFYAATDGNAANPGTELSPWTLTAALTNGRARGGDTILLKAGLYALTAVTTTTSGEAGKLVTVKPVPGETVIIDGQLIGGNYIHYQDLIITDSTFTDRSANNSTDGIQVGEGCEYYYCTIKNHGQGFTGGNNLITYKIHGCNVFYNGWDAILGHGLYIQHQGTLDKVYLTGNLVHDNFAWGFHIYGSQALRRFLLSRNVAFENGLIRAAPQPNIMVGGTAGIEATELYYNRTYHTGNADGMRVNNGSGNTALNTIANNNFVSGGGWRNIEIVENMTMTGNAIYGALEPATISDDYPVNTFGTFANTPDTIFLDALEDANRANLTIYNKQAQALTVQVDLTPLGWLSGSVLAANAMDELVDIQTLEITNGLITVDVNPLNRTIETPAGWDTPATTCPAFASLRLERV